MPTECPYLHDGFLALPIPSQKAAITILPIPYEATVSYKGGTREGPAAIIDASRNIETWEEETSTDLEGLSIATLPAMEVDGRGPSFMVDAIETTVAAIMDTGTWPLILGGEHTVTVGAVRAAAKCHSDLTVLQIDAHADLRDEWEGTPYSHACVMRRLREDGLATVSVGIRSISRDEDQYIAQEKPPIFWARDIVKKSDWIPSVIEALGDKVWITIDVDGLDPSVIPGTGTPEPGGLGWYPCCELLRAVAKERNVVGADVVELAPQSGSAVSEVAAAKLICKLLAYCRGDV